MKGSGNPNRKMEITNAIEERRGFETSSEPHKGHFAGMFLLIGKSN
jgi:hypothetical protein